MTSNNYNTIEEEIDLIDILWKLLAQWKAVVIVCIITMLLVPGVKYIKDKDAYKNEMEVKKSAKEAASISREEQIDVILESLSEDDRAAVRYVIQQQEAIKLQQEYLNNSIIINLNPADQRTLIASYLIRSDSSADMQTLVDLYRECLLRDELMDALRVCIAPDADIEYICELVDPDNTFGVSVDYDSADTAVFVVPLVLTEKADAEETAKLIDSALRGENERIAELVGSNTIERIGLEDTRRYNKNALDRRNNTLNAIYNLNNNKKNYISSLSEEQKAAIEAINAIEKSETSEVIDEIEKPSLNVKFVLLGFILGAILYSGCYIVLLVLRKTVLSASTIQGITGARLLGEVYKIEHRNGVARLFTSNSILRMRYGRKLDAASQINAAAATIDSVCAHYKVDRLALLLEGIPEELRSTAELFADKCKALIKDRDGILVTDEMAEEKLNSLENTVIFISNKTKLDKLDNLLSLCKDYDIRNLGIVYFETL